MNLTAWDSIKSKRRNPSLSSGHIILEFDRTKKQKIFAHKLGRITFETKDVNTSRNDVIEVQKGNLDLNGFVYKNVGHTYSDTEVTAEDPSLGGFPIYAHGHPLGGTEHGGMESCSREGLTCKGGEGTDDLCNPGKCLIGKLSHVRNKKWKYESVNTYDSDLPLIYYRNGTEEISLHTILRGKVVGFNNSEAVTLSITSPASKYTKIYLPPKYYFSEDFIDTAIKVIDERLTSVNNPPKLSLIGLENKKDKFISSFIILVYPKKSEGSLNNILYEDGVREEVKNQALSLFSTLPQKWFEQCSAIIEDEWLYREARIHTNFSFISTIYDRVKDLFGKIIQVTESSLKRGTLDYQKTSISRPVYSRLPGISEAYRIDPLFSEAESPAQWLTSGADDFLSKKKDQISSFYENYLDPETCSPLVLDWLAQHVGLTGDLWDTRWERKIKVALIKNAFGWFDREKTTTLPGVDGVKTPKGEALNQFPFSSSALWTSNELEDNSNKIKLDETNSLVYNSTKFISESLFKQRIYNPDTKITSVLGGNSIKIYDGKWNGLMEAKGSILSFAFLSSVFNLKSHSDIELETDDIVIQKLDGNKKYSVLVKKPKNGLRNVEVEAPPLWPYKPEILQVGGETDLKINNYSNQIVAGISRVTTLEDSKNVFFRVPYYYNRNGKSWDRVDYIAKNWLPDNLNKRTQYAYLSADLWAVGDGFFEPDLLDESIYESGLLLTEDQSLYLTTENGFALQHNFVEDIQIDESIYETSLILTEENQYITTENQSPLQYDIDESIYETSLILTEENQYMTTENQSPLNYA